MFYSLKSLLSVSSGWIEMSEEKNTNVYVSGLPLDITDAEFEVVPMRIPILILNIHADGGGVTPSNWSPPPWTP